MAVQHILDEVGGLSTLSKKEQVKKVAYAHYVQTNSTTFTQKDLAAIFSSNNLVIPNLSRELSLIVKDKPCEIFKTKKGYVLERGFIKVMDDQFGSKYSKDATNHFQDLFKRVHKQSHKEFLQDAIMCFNLKLYRPAIIMTWIVALDMLYDYVIESCLIKFNIELAKANKKLKIQSKVDFEDLKESQFIELLRASSIISKEQKKILDDKLDIRNSAAHPNATSFKEAKTATFIEELLNDIVATLPTDAQSLHSH